MATKLRLLLSLGAGMLAVVGFLAVMHILSNNGHGI